MKKVVIENWREYGDYMLYANVVSDLKLGIILQVDASGLSAFGDKDRVQRFEKELRNRVGSNIVIK